MFKMLFLAMTVMLTACSITPLKPEIDTSNQCIDKYPIKPNETRLILMNTASWLHKVDRTGHLNVWLNDKAVGYLPMKNFLIVNAPLGENKITLVHKDIWSFKSEHKVNFIKKKTFLKIFPTTISNGIELSNKMISQFRNALKKDILCEP